MTKKENPKQQQQQPTEDIQMAGKDIMVITGIKVKHLSQGE